MTREKPVREIKIGDDWTVPNLDGVGRRTLVQGAVWTVPVIAATVATPAFAASLAPTLEFVNGPYSATACSALPTIILQATTDGSVPAVGQSVTVTLPSGLTWSDGTTAPRSFVTDAAGQVSLTGIEAPAKDGTFAISAASGSLTATESVEVTGETGVVKTFSSSAAIRLPTGVAVADLKTIRTSTGDTQVLVLGTDGNAYRTTLNSGGNSFGAWSTSTAYPQATSLIALSNNGNGYGFLSDGSTVSNFANTDSVALPDGGQIVGLQSVTDGSGNPVVIALSANGNAYRATVTGGNFGSWQASPAFPNSTTLVAVNNSTPAYVFVTDGTTISNFAGTAAATLPDGGQVVEVDTITDPNGNPVVVARSSNGNVYRSTVASGAFGPWQTSPAFPGSATLVALNNSGNAYAFLTDGTTISNFAGTDTTTLPDGGQVLSLESVRTSSGDNVIVALSSTGNAYRSVVTNGNFGSWQVSTAFPNAATDVALNENTNAYAVVAGTEC
ncbi:hypothetical protein SAMN06295885_0360 [Rathayibacter oskolensis]|uniref:Uncharacterized protein n=1 Tax=Rathayibacter oskolensis TaxID=1891671 RepID=A0A1X7N0R4_9MICO|nr:hypothetical protein [Rathayibacter oskolensis]SMH29897.1 hypothetical protein SAMN06295885_0360 [Rathayibacter oskolensis]